MSNLPDRRTLSKLAKGLAGVNTTQMSHTKILDELARILGHTSQTAMMSALKSSEKRDARRKADAAPADPSLDAKVAALYEATFRARKDGPQDPFPRSDWAYEADNGDTSLGREDWWDAQLSRFLEDECGVEDALRRAEAGEIRPGDEAYVLSGPHAVAHFSVDEIFGTGFAEAWANLARDYASLSSAGRARSVRDIRERIETASRPKAVPRADIEMEVFRRVHGTDLDPLPREDFSYELINRDTNFSVYEEWWEHHIEHRGPEHWEIILGADLAGRVDAFTAFSDPQALAALRAEIAEELDLRVAAGVSLDMDPEEAEEAVAEHMHRKQAETAVETHRRQAEAAPVEERVNAKNQDLATSLLRLGMPRPRDLPGEPVWAEMWSDDRIVEVTVDVRPFLARMTASDYAALRLERFEPGNASDNAFYAMEKTDADAASLSAYLAAVNGGRVEVGFSVRIDAEAAEAWVAAHRPEIWGEPVLVEVRTESGDIFDMDVRPVLARADDATVSAVLGGDTDKLRSFGDVALSAAEAVVLYEEGREAAKDWAAACRPHILTSETRPGM